MPDAADPARKSEARHPPWAVAWVPALALALAGGSVVLPALALPAMMVVLLAAVRERGRVRWLVAGAGGLAAAVGLYRFTLEWAVPNIVSSGQFAAEERAVSRLREILWAEDRVREKGWVDRDGDGVGEYAFLGELLGRTDGAGARRAALPMALLRTEQFHPLTDGVTPVYRSEGYAFVVYLPGPGGGGVGEGRGAVDGPSAARRFVAYAWPVEWGKGGTRAFYIDQDDRICETSNAQAYSGTSRIPSPAAALGGSGLASPPCLDPASDEGRWKAWKNKKPRPPQP